MHSNNSLTIQFDSPFNRRSPDSWSIISRPDASRVRKICSTLITQSAPITSACRVHPRFRLGRPASVDRRLLVNISADGASLRRGSRSHASRARKRVAAVTRNKASTVRNRRTKINKRASLRAREGPRRRRTSGLYQRHNYALTPRCRGCRARIG